MLYPIWGTRKDTTMKRKWRDLALIKFKLGADSDKYIHNRLEGDKCPVGVSGMCNTWEGKKAFTDKMPFELKPENVITWSEAV